MSTYKAIAAVSKTLKDLLLDRMEDLTTTPVAVTLAPPDIIISGITGRRLNLYLFQVTENGSLKNQEIPGQGHPGAFGRPPLSLDLHYLMTAYAESDTKEDSDRTAQEVLGNAMRVFHDYSIIPPGLHQKDDPVQPAILDPILTAEYERIKIALQPVSIEEISKIWTAMPQASFRRSVLYQVSVVQIESRLPRRQAPPVQKRRVSLTLSRRPEITAVYRTPATPQDPTGDPRVKALQEITVEGLRFNATQTWVRLGGLAPVPVVPVSSEEIRVTVPDDPLLQPGPQAVEVLTEQALDGVEGGLGAGKPTSPPVTQKLGSNNSFFLLVPEIATLSASSGKAADSLTLTGKRLAVPGRPSFVLVGDAALPVPDPNPALPPPSPTSVTVSLALLATLLPVPPALGTKVPVRVLVDGAQNLEENLFTLLPP
ncbi:MAG: Pvc16 family protein [Thermoanaerobaculia bacterium]